MSEEKMFEAQIITLGDAQVGKSSFILQYVEGRFEENYLSTIGFDSKITKKKWMMVKK